MSKIQRLMRALLNNKISNPLDYTLIRADETGYIYVQHNISKKEFKIHVEGAEPVCELCYTPIDGSKPFKQGDITQKQNELINDLQDKIKERNEDFDKEKNKYDKKNATDEPDFSKLQEEIDRLKEKQKKEIKNFQKKNNIKDDEVELDEELIKKMISKEISNTKYPDRPKGWDVMPVYVSPDGDVYYKGKEQPDLKGTLPPTVYPKKK